jgi:hypothetical protein
MRILVLLALLVAAPFATGVAQHQSHNNRRDDRHERNRPKCERQVDNRDHDSSSRDHDSGGHWWSRLFRRWERRHQHGHDNDNCDPGNPPPQPPPPPPPPVPPPPPPPPPAGNAMVEGNVFDDGSNGPLSSWSVQLSGTISAVAQTNENGYYSFMNLPAGTYQVCIVMQSGWTQAFPNSDTGTPCPDGNFGYTYVLSGSVLASFVDFRNTRTTP